MAVIGTSTLLQKFVARPALADICCYRQQTGCPRACVSKWTRGGFSSSSERWLRHEFRHGTSLAVCQTFETHLPRLHRSPQQRWSSGLRRVVGASTSSQLPHVVFLSLVRLAICRRISLTSRNFATAGFISETQKIPKKLHCRECS